MVDRRKSLHKKTLEEKVIAGRPVLSTYIPYSSFVERMGERREPLPVFSRKSEPSLAFYDLWNDINSLG
jgi:cellulose biosynthesis protein BcsQ